MELTEGLELMGMTCDELAIESFHKEKMTKKRHKLKGPESDQLPPVIFIQTKGESLIEVINPSGNKSRVTREKARAMWNEYIDIGWRVAK